MSAKERIYSIEEACKELKFGRTKLYQLISSKEIRIYKVGSRTYIPNDEIDRFIQRRLSDACKTA